MDRQFLTHDVLRSLKRNRLRSTLAIACIAAGVAGLLGAINYAAAGRAQLEAAIGRLGPDVIAVSADLRRVSGARTGSNELATTLRFADYRALRHALPELTRASALVMTRPRLKASGLSKVVPAYGVEPDYFQLKAWRPATGRLLDPHDKRAHARVAVLGHGVARDLFGEANPVGRRLLIDRTPFEIIGVLEERGPGLDLANEDDAVYLPLTTAMRRVLQVEHYHAILLQLPDVSAAVRAVPRIKRLLQLRHRSSAERPDDFRVSSPTQLIATSRATSERMSLMIGATGFCSLLIAGLGVIAITWMALRERRPEIGLRRAVGATAAAVFQQFTAEALVLATVGAGLGIGLAALGGRAAASLVSLPIVFAPTTASIVFGSAVLFYVLCSGWPAFRAASLTPTAALKAE